MISILVVENDPGVRETTTDMLRETGYSVTEAADGIEGLQHLSEKTFDVVILDVRLPRLDGPAVLDVLHVPPPVILISAFGYLDENELRARFGSKVFAFLQKPISPGHLLAVVADALRGHTRA